jgi:hypothetical protein
MKENEKGWKHQPLLTFQTDLLRRSSERSFETGEAPSTQGNYVSKGEGMSEASL